MSQHQDVLLVDRRHERAVGEVVDLVGDLVTAMLDVTKRRVMAPLFVQRTAELTERLPDELALLVEKFVKAALPQNEVQFRDPTPPQG